MGFIFLDVSGSTNTAHKGSRPMQAQQYVRTLPMILAVCLLATSVLRAQAPAPPPPPSVTKGQAAPNLTASYLTSPDANGRRQKKGG